MRDLRSTRLLWTKAVLFLSIGFVSCGLILLEAPELYVLLLLALAVWSFCRAYYFAFYVLERYVDPSYRFSGLFSLARHLWKKRKGGPNES
jgi:hypothetical protein